MIETVWDRNASVRAQWAVICQGQRFRRRKEASSNNAVVSVHLREHLAENRVGVLIDTLEIFLQTGIIGLEDENVGFFVNRGVK